MTDRDFWVLVGLHAAYVATWLVGSFAFLWWFHDFLQIVTG